MKKVYVLTCTNEESTVVSVDVFSTMAQAKIAMKGSYERELEESERQGYEPDVYDGIEDITARVSYGDCFYDWLITEADVK